MPVQLGHGTRAWPDHRAGGRAPDATAEKAVGWGPAIGGDTGSDRQQEAMGEEAMGEEAAQAIGGEAAGAGGPGEEAGSHGQAPPRVPTKAPPPVFRVPQPAHQEAPKQPDQEDESFWLDFGWL